MRLLISLAVPLALTVAPAVAQDDDALKWAKPLSNGPQTLSHLLTAVSGKPNSAETDSLLVGVKALVREKDDFRLVRSDGEELLVPRDSHMGDRMFCCMQKLENEAREKVGDPLANYVHNVDALTVNGENVELHHSGAEDVHIPLPTNQPWLPVRLKELHLKNIHLKLVDGNNVTVHKIKELDGIAAVVHTAGVDISVEPREFWRFHDKQGNTRVVLGIANPVPAPVRRFLCLPEVVRVHYTFKKDHEKAEANNSAPAAQ